MYLLKQASATSHDRMRRRPTITGQSPLGSGFRLRRTTGGLLANDTKIRALYLQMSGNFANIAGQSRRFGRQRRQSVPLYRHCPSGRLSRKEGCLRWSVRRPNHQEHAIFMEETSDVYRTVDEPSAGEYYEKRSKFLAFLEPVHSLDEVKERVDFYQKKYYDARHCCYAYVLGPERKDFRANDNGEPSGTAGKPILGQINSNELTDVLVVVIRYFGGIKLGTSGLIVAYRMAAADAIAQAQIVEKTVDEEVTFFFEYPFMNAVMRIVKEENPAIVAQGYDNDCSMTLRIRKNAMPRLKERLEKVETLRFEEQD